MKRLFSLLLCLAALDVAADNHLTLELSNPLNTARTDCPVSLNIQAYGLVKSARVTIDGQEVPCQLDDLDNNGTYDELAFVTDMGKRQKKTAQIDLYSTGTPRQYAPRTFAEMVIRNPKVKEKNKHDIYISAITVDKETENSYNLLHHHGVAMENELIALRIYFDKRQTLDLYGKFKKGLELKETQFYTSPEQKQQGYGDDILWVGNTFGLGAFRGWNGTEPTMLDKVDHRTQRIIAKGPVRTIVEVEDRGWDYKSGEEPLTLVLRYTIYAGQRDIHVSATFNRDTQNGRFSTGLINVKNSTEYTDHHGLRGLWGTDWPSSDTINWKRETVGMGIYMPKEYLDQEMPANKDNYTYVIRPQARQINYVLCYGSDNETFGFHSADAWFDFLKKWKKEVSQPIICTVK